MNIIKRSLTVGLSIVGYLSVYSAKAADDLDSGIQRAFSEIGKGFAELSDGLNEMTDGLNQAAEDARKGMTSSSQLVFGQKTFAIRESVSSIKITIVSGDDIVIKTGNISQPRISVYAFTDQENKSRLDLMFSSLQFSVRAGKLELESGLNSNYCMRSRVDNELSGKGSCYDRVVVEIPEAMAIVVRDKRKVLNSASIPFDKQEMLAMIQEAGHTSDKVKILKDELKGMSPRAIFSASEVADIINDISFSENKKESFEILLNYTDLSNPEELGGKIDQIFSFGSDKEAAQQMLLRQLGRHL